MTPHPDGLAAAKAKATPGQCIFCEEPLPETKVGRKRIICASVDCTQAYNSAWKRDRLKGKVTWHCPCGVVSRRSGWGSHKKSCMFAVDAFPVVVIGALTKIDQPIASPKVAA